MASVDSSQLVQKLSMDDETASESSEFLPHFDPNRRNSAFKTLFNVRLLFEISLVAILIGLLMAKWIPPAFLRDAKYKRYGPTCKFRFAASRSAS